MNLRECTVMLGEGCIENENESRPEELCFLFTENEKKNRAATPKNGKNVVSSILISKGR